MSVVPRDFNPENADNNPVLVMAWAREAAEWAESYFGILKSKRGSELMRSKLHNEVYEHFRRDFPDFDPAATIIDDSKSEKKKRFEDEIFYEGMKTEEGKKRWRAFMESYKGRVGTYNKGMLLRSNPRFESNEETLIFAHRMQWDAIEISRNRLGLNDWIYEQAQQERDEAARREKEEKDQSEAIHVDQS